MRRGALRQTWQSSIVATAARCRGHLFRCHSRLKSDTISAFYFLVQWWGIMPKHKFKIAQRLFLVRLLNAPESSMPGMWYMIRKASLSISSLPLSNCGHAVTPMLTNQASKRA